MAQANTAAVSFTCVAGTDMAGCAELVGNGGAELTTQQGEWGVLRGCYSTAFLNIRRFCAHGVSASRRCF
jgi:hypothetical protein